MRRAPVKLGGAGLLGVAAAALVACGSSGGGLIPAAQAGPLQTDIEAVEKAAEEGNGSCKATEEALLKTDQDYAVLPASVNATLRGKLRLGIENLHKVAREACAQPLGGTTTTTTKTPLPAPTTQTTTTSKAPPTTPTTTPSTPAPPVHEHEEAEHGTGGGTAAPGESEAPGSANPEENAGSNGAGGNGAGGSEGK